MNFIAKSQAWLKTLPPGLQTSIYAFETALATAIAAFLYALYMSLTCTKNCAPFDWQNQLHLLWIALAAGAVKLAIDGVKMLGGQGPTQVKPDGTGATGLPG